MTTRPIRSFEFPRGAVLPVLAGAAWWIATASGLASGPFAVSPLQVAAVPFADPAGRELWAALAASLARVLAGGLTGAVLGLALGYVAGLYRFAAIGLSPTLHTARQVALFAWIPLLTAWFGNGEATKFAFTALSTFFPLFLATEQGVRQTPVALIEAAETLKLSPRTRLTRLYLPAALPSIEVGLQIAVLSAWIGTIGAEYAVGNGRGLGSYLASARDQFRMDIVVVGVLALAAGGVTLHHLVGRVVDLLFPWAKD